MSKATANTVEDLRGIFVMEILKLKFTSERLGKQKMKFEDVRRLVELTKGYRELQAIPEVLATSAEARGSSLEKLVEQVSGKSAK